jgi:membrane protease subunit (stomatin/prohibitin family)
MDRLWQKVRDTFIDVIEWTDEEPLAAGGGRDTLVWRFDRHGGAIRMGAQLIVREGQWAVFVNEGRIADGFGPGRHRLSTRNLPLLTSLLCLPYGFESPFKAEVIFVATRLFTDLRWGTRHPLIVRDPELGPVRLRGFGTYTLQRSGLAGAGDHRQPVPFRAGRHHRAAAQPDREPPGRSAGEGGAPDHEPGRPLRRTGP